MQIWNWSAFFTDLTSPIILTGVWTTVWLTFVTLFLAIVLGTAVALVQRSQLLPARWFYQGYVAFFRATPLLVILVFLYSALPQMGIRLSVVSAAIIGLVLSESPYVAEIVRSALNAVAQGQWEAGKALGVRPGTIMRLIVFPQALRVAIPPLGNEFVRQLKNTSLVSVISMSELFRATDNLIQASFRVLEALTVATLYYLLLTAAWTLAQRAYEHRQSRWLSRERHVAAPPSALEAAA